MKRIAPIQLKSGQKIGPGQPCFIVAEIGNNHQGEFVVAKEMIQAAANAGVQAVKFQKRDTCSLFTRAGREAPYSGANSFGPTYGEHRDALELSIEQLAELKQISEDLGLVFFASAWDMFSLEQMFDLDVELVKICSADLVNIPMLRRVGENGAPVIISTGMSELDDIDLAVAELRRYHSDIVVLHCNSSYPCPDDQVSLPVMQELAERYGLPVGYSGHEQGVGPSVASVALGATVVERHFTLDKTMRGTDHQASLEPAELELLCKLTREVEASMLVEEKKVFPTEANAAKKLRKSIVYARDLPSGHTLTEADLTVKCPGTGVSPIQWDDVVDGRLTRSVRADEPLSWDDLTVEASVLTDASSS